VFIIGVSLNLRDLEHANSRRYQVAQVNDSTPFLVALTLNLTRHALHEGGRRDNRDLAERIERQ
jgi:hypothetical protein